MDVEYFSDDIVIVSKSCVLPDANNPNDFWLNLKNKKTSVQPISDWRWDKNINYSPYREIDDKTYSHWGAEVSQKIYEELERKFSIRTQSKMELLATEALNQAIYGINLPLDRKKIAIILGAMNPDENYYITRFKQQVEGIYNQLKVIYSLEEFSVIEPYLKAHCQKLFKDVEENIDDLLPTSVLNKLKKRFNIQGPQFLVDAACAAGIASIDSAMVLLKNKEIDFSFVGGVESNLGQGSYVLFSKVGALAPTQTLPFDERTQGLSQGEGAVIFGIQRLADAIAMGNPILGVVKSIGSSSDGKVASLFQPDSGGQILALTRAYQNLQHRRVDYLELHGTGTQIGDLTESQSTAKFFTGFKIPVGSVKYNVGHTKATAGATGLLKCLLCIENEIIPASEYCENSIFKDEGDLFINRKEIKLNSKHDVVRCGISSFGFGGTNFHLVVENYLGPKFIKSQKIEKKSSELFPHNKVVLVGKSELSFDDFNEGWFTQKDVKYKVPPKAIPFIDKAQLLAVRAVENLLFNDLKIILNQKIKDEVQVISASTIGLDILDDIVARISLDTIAETIKQENLYPRLVEEIGQIKNQYQKVSEESGPGILNNVIAGRVCNAFHFRGRNFNIDCDQNSIEAAMYLIQSEFQFRTVPIIILVGIQESVDIQNLKVKRHKVVAYCFSNFKFAKDNFLPISQNMEIKNG